MFYYSADRILVGKSVNIVTESEYSNINTQNLKAIVSGDYVMAEIKNGKFFEFKPSVKLIFAMNKLPQTNDYSQGFKRRLVIIPFDEIFTGNRVDKFMNEKLAKEASGILLFALKGLQRLRKNNFTFTEPERCKKALRQYFDTIDPIGMFVRENIKPSEGSRVMNKMLYERFISWANNEGDNPNISRRAFIEQFKTALHANNIKFDTAKSGGERYITMIKLKN